MRERKQMTVRVDYYQVLGLPPGCTPEEINSRFRQLLRKYQADAATDKDTIARQTAMTIQAYGVLSDPRRREVYDRESHSPQDVRSASRPPHAAAKSAGVKHAPSAEAAASDPKRRRTTRPITPPATPTMPSATGESRQPKAPERRRPHRTAPIGTYNLLDQARKAVWQRDWTKAEDLCTGYLKSNPNCPNGFELLGDIFAQDGRLKQAVNCYRRAHKLDPARELLRTKINCIRGSYHYQTSAAEEEVADEDAEPHKDLLAGFYGPSGPHEEEDADEEIVLDEPERKRPLGWMSGIFRKS